MHHRCSRPRRSFIVIDREDVLNAAIDAERQGSFQEMLEHMALLAALPEELDQRGCGLLSRACRGAVDAKRQALLNAAADEASAALKGDFEVLCNRAIKLALHQLGFASTPYGRVFYRKMAADYSRYMAWFSSGGVTGTAQRLYEEAAEEANAALPCTDALRLSLELNRAVFTHDILVQRHRAVSIAAAALEQVEKAKDALGSRELESIALRLRENLDAWSWEEAADRSKDTAVSAKTGRQDSELDRARRALLKELQRCADLNLSYPSNCRIIGHSSVEDTWLSPGFACQFGQRRAIVNVSCSDMNTEEDLALVVRTGGGFVEFVELVRRYGPSEAPMLPSATRKDRPQRRRPVRRRTASAGAPKTV
mmetsp:Transcript_58861/g.137500  ORF Transcript_58861/g.137500 Transcript_58861/m.137500 type:complete len:367 (+) Transcript_58861:53-1153(+)